MQPTPERLPEIVLPREAEVKGNLRQGNLRKKPSRKAGMVCPYLSRLQISKAGYSRLANFFVSASALHIDRTRLREISAANRQISPETPAAISVKRNDA